MAEINITENERIICMAEELSMIGLKAKDAIHIACAAYAESDYFLTTDISVLKKTINCVKVINPVDLIRETEGE